MKTFGIYRLLFLFISLAFIASVSSAASTKGTMGTWKVDPAGKKNFEQEKVVQGYTYYFVGPVENPDSVMMISDKYKLHESKFWAKKLDMADHVLREWNQAWKQNDSLSSKNSGTIVDPKGNIVGYWMSDYPGGAVKVLDNGEIEVFQPYPVGSTLRPGQGS